MTRFDKKQLDEKFITDNSKYRNKEFVVETKEEECEISRRSSEKIKPPLPLSYA